jgi:hypothetical protein
LKLAKFSEKLDLFLDNISIAIRRGFCGIFIYAVFKIERVAGQLGELARASGAVFFFNIFKLVITRQPQLTAQSVYCIGNPLKPSYP